MSHLLRSLLSLSVLSLPLAAQTGAARAVYEVTFEATWSSSTHPGAYPAGAHFSPLIGATHAAGTHLWEPGGLATPGIELMAETGGTSLLANEINAAIANGTARAAISGAGIDSPDATSQLFVVTDEFPAVTLVTMIAPSPDWFVGTDAVELFENGAWVDEKVVALLAWDAGTDSGPNFTSGDQDTNPQQPIALVTGGPFTGSDPLGTFTFRRLRSSLEYGTCANPAGSLSVAVLPRLGRTSTFSIDDPGATMPNPSLAYISFSMTPDAAFPCGTARANWGLAGVGAGGELLQNGPQTIYALTPWTGAATDFLLDVPNDMALIGVEFYAQGALVDPGNRVGLTSGLKMIIGA